MKQRDIVHLVSHYFTFGQKFQGKFQKNAGKVHIKQSHEPLTIFLGNFNLTQLKYLY